MYAHGVVRFVGQTRSEIGEELGAEASWFGDDGRRGGRAVGGGEEGGGELIKVEEDGLEERGLVPEGVKRGVDCKLWAVCVESGGEVREREEVFQGEAFGVVAAVEVGDVGGGALGYSGEDDLCCGGVLRLVICCGRGTHHQSR